MPSTMDIIYEAESLPVEDRAMIVDSLLRSLNTPDAEHDRIWGAVAERRLAELQSGQVQAIPGEVVLANLRERWAR